MDQRGINFIHFFICRLKIGYIEQWPIRVLDLGHAVVYLYVMLRTTHLSITMPSNASFSLHQNIIFVLAIMLYSYTMYRSYKHAGSIIKNNQSLGEKEHRRENPKRGY